jgi:hypothetical protein
LGPGASPLGYNRYQARELGENSIADALKRTRQLRGTVEGCCMMVPSLRGGTIIYGTNSTGVAHRYGNRASNVTEWPARSMKGWGYRPMIIVITTEMMTAAMGKRGSKSRSSTAGARKNIWRITLK